MKTKRHDVNNTLLFTREGGKMKRIKKFIVKHRVKLIFSLVAVILILCGLMIGKQFFIALLGLFGFPALNAIDKKNADTIKDLKAQREDNREVLNEKSKDINNRNYNDVDLSNNESVKHIKKRIRDRKNKS
jgi:hypothetical protein